MKNKIAITSASILFAANSFASSNMKVIVGGSLDTQYGFIKEKPLFRQINPQDPTKGMRRSNVLSNNGKVTIAAEGEADSGVKYGGKIEFNANPSVTKSGSKAIVNKSVIFAEFAFGKLEVGSYDSASGELSQSAATIAKGTDGIDGDFGYYVNNTTADGYDNGDIFIISPGMPVGHDTSGSANKITYYTPQYNGLQLGVSFIPDGAAKGTVKQAMSLPANTFDSTVAPADLEHSAAYKNIIDASLQYKAKVMGVEVTSSLSGQLGQSKDYKDTGSVTHKRKQLRAWQVGSVATYNGFSLAASYGDWGHSGLYKTLSKNFKRRSSYYTLGAAYEYDKWATSVTYLNSSAAAGSYGGLEATKYDKAKVLSMAVDYKVVDGLKAYVEVTNFNLNRADAAKNKGTVTIVGTKLKF